MVKRTMGTTEWALVGLLALLWGGSFFFVEVMLEAMDPATAVLLRVVPAAAALDYIAGFTLFNDWSARDLQTEEMAFGLGPVDAEWVGTGRLAG